jgi:acylphosphatase
VPVETAAPALRFVVDGRVQRVSYRAATAMRAAELGLRGWAKNLPDGRVEVVAAGPMQAITELTSWLWQGPPAARVDCVHIEEWSLSVPAGFAVL